MQQHETRLQPSVSLSLIDLWIFSVGGGSGGRVPSPPLTHLIEEANAHANARADAEGIMRSSRRHELGKLKGLQ